MQPTAQTGIVWKISIFLFILLGFVLYKMNDYFKQEKYSFAQNQLRTQIVSLKTSVSSQISTLKNVLSSYEYDLNESKINWVQLDPFFGIAKAERVGGRNSNNYRVTEFVSRSGSIGAGWNAQFLHKALTRQRVTSDEPITIQVFRDQVGTKFMSLRFTNPNGRALIVVGAADYFQKYFDLSRGGKVTALLETTDRVLAAHSEADYLGSLMDENAVSTKKFLVEKEEIAGTNLIAMNFVGRKNLAKGFVVPWSVVGLIFGFGFLIIGVLIYTLDPIERRIEKYKMQEREQIFKETLSTSLANQEPIAKAAAEPPAAVVVPSAIDAAFADQDSDDIEAPTITTATDLVKAKLGSLAASKENSTELSIVDLLKPPVSTVAPPPVQVNLPLTPPPPPPEALAKAKSSVREGTGSIVLDSSQIETFEYLPSESDHIDLDQALSLDDIESEEVSQQSVQVVKENLTPKSINVSQQMSDVSKPSFSVRKKEFRVDSIEVPIRRPERS